MSFWEELFGSNKGYMKAMEHRQAEKEQYDAYIRAAKEYEQAMLQRNYLQNQLQNNQISNPQLYQYWQTYGTGSQTSAAMAATPESKVKDKVCAALNDMDVYYTKPVTGGFGNNGVPDIVACVEGRFFGIECKAKGKKPTALQEKHLKDITASGGVSLVIDETNVDTVRELILANIGVANEEQDK